MNYFSFNNKFSKSYSKKFANALRKNLYMCVSLKYINIYEIFVFPVSIFLEVVDSSYNNRACHL